MPEETTDLAIDPMRVAGYAALATIATLGARRAFRFIRDIRTDDGRVENLSQVAAK